ncbi:MAG: hypothetical protein C0606_04260 [Hyphomicrobiales bacterium]|nr:MAG: hypothetical protein C0606_04260 [Hyphomicrobiales bacterium]
MFDSMMRRMIDPPLNVAGRGLAALGIGANAVTVGGFALGLAAAAAIASGQFALGLAFLLANRLADGLDGAVARATEKSDLGGYLDIVFDFLFYGAIPLGFAIVDPNANGLAAAVLLASFYANGAAFLAFSTMAAKRGLETSAQGLKSLYYVGGLAEGTETIAVFISFCLWPAHFPLIAFGFAALCFLSAAARILFAVQTLRG